MNPVIYIHLEPDAARRVLSDLELFLAGQAPWSPENVRNCAGWARHVVVKDDDELGAAVREVAQKALATLGPAGPPTPEQILECAARCEARSRTADAISRAILDGLAGGYRFRANELKAG